MHWFYDAKIALFSERGLFPEKKMLSDGISPNQIRQINKLLHRQLLRPFVEHLVLDDVGAEHGAQRALYHYKGEYDEGVFG